MSEVRTAKTRDVAAEVWRGPNRIWTLVPGGCISPLTKMSSVMAAKEKNNPGRAGDTIVLDSQ